MTLSSFSINRPVMTVMGTLLVMILGGVSLRNLPIDLMPDISMPRLSISTNYGNASPEEVEELITRPIEEAVAAVPGVEEIESDSGEGRSRVSISFVWGTDIDAASNDVRDRLDRIIARLPDDADRPTMRKFSPSDFPILVLGVASDLDPTVLRTMIDNQVKFRVERVNGVAAIDIRGGNEREIHIDLDQWRMKAMKISLNQIISRIRDSNVNLPAGSIHLGNMDIRLRTPGTFNSLEQLADTVVAMVDDAPVKVRDLGTVVDSWVEKTSNVLVNGKPGIQLMVYKQSGSNTVEVAQSVIDEIESINRDFPRLSVIPIIDTSQYIKSAITNMSQSTLYGSMLAILVLMLFLRNISSTAIVGVCIPISVIATFLLIFFRGYTLNIMTLGGLALGVGMLVDNAIVVMENILRLRDSGHSSMESAENGSEEVTSAIIASTVTTVVVFLPLIFMRGMIGAMFEQLANVVGFSLLCSLVVAISLVPMIASRVLKPSPRTDNPNPTFGERLFIRSSAVFEAIENTYRDILAPALRHPWFVVVACFTILGSSLLLTPMIGTELNPEADENEVRVDGELEVGIRLDVITEKFKQIQKIIEREVPEMRSSRTTVGGNPWRPGEANKGQVRISLYPRAERDRSDTQIAAALSKALDKIPGVKIRTRKGQGLFLLRMASGGTERISIEIRGHNFDTASALANQVAELTEQVPGVTDTRISQSAGTPEETLVIDRRKAEEMKLSVSQIGEALKTALSGTKAGEFRDGGDEFSIRVKMKDSMEFTMEEILDFTVTNSQGVPVVLKNVVNVVSTTGPTIVARKDQERIVEIRVNISGRDMGSIVEDIREAIKAIPIPRNYSISFGGDFEEQQKAFRELMFSFALAVILVYMVMASQFESLRDPLIVMFSLPFAAIGVILMLFLTDTTLNMQSFIGCIMLAGIVVNNAILLVDYTNLLRRRDNMELFEAIREAGRRRLRPILMTAMTTSLALIPLAIGFGEGGEAQAPMARAVIGGLLSSTLVTLVLVPVIYSLFEREGKEFK
ncbi:MAG: acriflavin resistance protein [Candidatus Wallbacteria bacterium HGW-Wallbacteria-1]|jgi:HAE1 family hydrophobic/amphiphilic exporter-1|uniref:Acriflavin resistance protein n=1 Tax=Candidatus Wallbacteria bacterium HGW-Wallbacteria-1 TaxID=2013854 RepID=A0A2N1PL81_9BACT|nr:MAG: acriflavin resistance protein [Candidatus Wallbacteria bacterium HGW-Wallbacteria-1]